MWRTILPIGLVLLLMAVSLGCVGKETPEGKEDVVMTREFSLTSTGFKEGENILTKYTCDGQDLSPALSWGEVPKGTKSVSLIMDDPDAPMRSFTHGVIYNIPADKQNIPEGAEKKERLADGSLQEGINDFGKIGYNGPCPPPGRPHRYYFKIYALNKKLDLAGGATRDDVEKAMEGHVLAKREMMGKYGR